MPLTSAQKTAAYRARQREAGLPDVTRKNRKNERKKWKASRPTSPRFRPFTGCDGEGAKTDALGRQLYLLFRMGDRELHTGERLSTYELLDFICDHPPGEILVGFAFGYDVTMILRDLPEAQQRRLFEPKTFGEGHSPYVWYRDFDIDYLPKNYLKVRRVKIERQEDGSEKRIGIKGSSRTIFETFGFFQKSFLKVITEFEVGTSDERELIRVNKERRGDFVEMGDEERVYCALECRMLAELMEKLRQYCEEGGIRPRSWSGAGKLAAALLSLHETVKGATVRECTPPEVDALANMAYYGGRFEITRTGAIQAPLYEYDIRSAYPAAMPYLPCLVCGDWRRASSKTLSRYKGIYLAGVSFRAPPSSRDNYGQLGGLPVRSKDGHLYWPLAGAGVYWSHEIESAKRLGFKISYREGWTYETSCSCTPFNWVEPLFDYRRSIGSSGPGYPIKLGINSLYGKLAQRKGNGAFNNMVWAGLITAMTRAKLNDAIACSVERYGPGRIVMIATDALYSLDPLPELEQGDWLGAWEEVKLDGLFIVQPGLYWCPVKKKRKSRGLSGKFFEEEGRTESFERAWSDFEASENSRLELDFPKVSVPVPGFIGLKLAISRNKPELAGKWVQETREISFDYRNKRVGHVWRDGHIITKPKMGSIKEISLPHRDFLKAGGAEPWEAARAMLEEQPDFVDMGIPWKD